MGRITEVSKNISDLNIEAYDIKTRTPDPILEVLIGLPSSRKIDYTSVNDKIVISKSAISNRSILDPHNIDSIFNKKFLSAVQKGQNIIIDGEYTTVKSRCKLFNISKLIKNYHKKAVVFLTPYSMVLDMVNDKDLIDSTIKSFEMPTYEEFDSIEFRFSF